MLENEMIQMCYKTVFTISILDAAVLHLAAVLRLRNRITPCRRITPRPRIITMFLLIELNSLEKIGIDKKVVCYHNCSYLL